MAHVVNVIPDDIEDSRLTQTMEASDVADDMAHDMSHDMAHVAPEEPLHCLHPCLSTARDVPGYMVICAVSVLVLCGYMATRFIHPGIIVYGLGFVTKNNSTSASRTKGKSSIDIPCIYRLQRPKHKAMVNRICLKLCGRQGGMRR